MSRPEPAMAAPPGGTRWAAVHLCRRGGHGKTLTVARSPVPDRFRMPT